jgi:phage terminase large subunit GpA-like protein
VTTEQLTAEWAHHWLPPEKLTLSQWAERNFVLSPEYSAVTGKLKLFGWQREIFDSFTDPTVNKIVLKVGTQLVKTLFIQAAVAYVIAEAPGPILMVQPKDSDAETFSKERLGPMIRDNESLYSRLPGGKSPLNTITYKQFPGGSLTLVGSIVPGNMARRSIQYFFCDEINKYPASAGGEGSPLRLGEERTVTFGTRAKTIYTCSPTDEAGVISREYEASNKKVPWVICHRCGYEQVLRWTEDGNGSGHVWWSKEVAASDRPQTARYICGGCQAQWNDVQRWRAVELSRWIPQKPFTGSDGYWISHLSSPHKTLSKMVKAFLDANATGDANELKVFINTNLAEDWQERGDAPDWKKLFDRRANYPIGTVPAGALILTAGVDVQNDRLEVQVVGWGRRKQSWKVDYLVLYGDTARAEVWAELTKVLGIIYEDAKGREFIISRLAIDSGYASQQVYDWARTQKFAPVRVVKGGPDSMQATVGPQSPVEITVNGKKLKSGVRIQLVNVSELKKQFYGWLHLELPNLEKGEEYPEGFFHFCATADTEEYCKQLTAEQLVTRTHHGFQKREWEKTRPRNEALDTWIYAKAASIMLGLDKCKESQWDVYEQSLIEKVKAEPVLQAVAVAEAQTPERKGSWIPRKGWFAR